MSLRKSLSSLGQLSLNTKTIRDNTLALPYNRNSTPFMILGGGDLNLNWTRSGRILIDSGTGA